MESLHEKITTCHSNPEKLSATKINKHAASGYSLLIHCLFDNRKKKHNYFRGKNCKKILFQRFKNHGKKTINYEKKRNENNNK